MLSLSISLFAPRPASTVAPAAPAPGLDFTAPSNSGYAAVLAGL